MITTESGDKQPLPKQVREHDTAKTSVYRQGELIYDGATGQAVGSGVEGGAPPVGPGASLNEMLKWSIEHSDPGELARRAASGEVRAPSQLDKEIMDHIMGQPIVAKMRECLSKLESSALCTDGGLDGGCAMLEELEYYAEDIDHALDLVKIGGLQALRRCCAFGLLDPEDAPAATAEAAAAEKAAAAGDGADDAAALREAGCGVLAAMLQNNPKVVRAAEGAGVGTMLLALLHGDAERVGGVAVVRKALLALSALLRTSVSHCSEETDGSGSTRTLSSVAEGAENANGGAEGEDAGMVALVHALPTLLSLASHADLKVRRRALFLLASVACERTQAATAIVAATTALDSGDLTDAFAQSLQSDDEDVRTQCERLLVCLADLGDASSQLAQKLAAGGTCADAARVALAKAEGNAEEAASVQRVLLWLSL